ncbi:hypothetical protein N9955_00855 [bacterium]|nr:hypothetical protein [bacterium]
MIYDFSFKTGVDINSLYSPLKLENISGQYNNSSYYLSNTGITGNHKTRLSLNGQTFLEQTPELTTLGFSEYYQNSGDYFFKTGESFTRAFFDENLSVSSISEKRFFYGVRDYDGEAPFGSGISGSGIQNAFAGELAKKFSDRTGTISGIESFDYFLNGQKIYSGISGSYMISGAGNLFYYNDNITGKLFAIPKNTGLLNITGEIADVYNQDFVESTVFSYLNGVALDRKNWMELYTGVTSIQTGIQPSSFDLTIETEAFSL